MLGNDLLLINCWILDKSSANWFESCPM